MLALAALLALAPPVAPALAACESQPVRGAASVCEVRAFTLPDAGALTVRNPVSGSIRVAAWDRDEIGVRAEVRAYESRGRTPEALLAATEIRASGGALVAETEGGGWVETRYVVHVPRETDLDLRTNNGAVSVTGVTGTLRIDTNNGAVRLADVGGDVDARSNSGAVTVDLGGATWAGAGLRAFANDGALTLRVPAAYSAVVEADVRWGYINAPDALSPSAETRRVYLGAGGPTLRVSANSGSVRIERG